MRKVQPAIAIATMVVLESADSSDILSRHFKTADNSAAAKDLTAGESVAATVTGASSTTGMRNQMDRARIDATFLTTADRDMIERHAQQKAAELSSVSATDRKINFLASKCSIESLSTTTYTIYSLLHEVSSCEVCRGELTIERDTCEYGVAGKQSLVQQVLASWLEMELMTSSWW